MELCRHEKANLDLIPELERRIKRLERHMSRVDDVIAQLNTATDEIARDLADLRDQIENLDPETAAKFEPLLARLTALGQDPSNPVPNPEPSPGEPTP
jgi:septal ring factor EnvC (AmiA/AmiB activator)